MKDFIRQLILSHIGVLNSLLKQYKSMGGDVTVFGDTDCPTGFYRNEEGNCVPKNDPVEENPGG